MKYVTTNIRLPKQDYLKLKSEAAQKQQSLAAVIRSKLADKKRGDSPDAAQLLDDLERQATTNAEFLSDWDSVQALRDMRYGGKW